MADDPAPSYNYADAINDMAELAPGRTVGPWEELITVRCERIERLNTYLTSYKRGLVVEAVASGDVTLKDAARQASVSESTVRAWMKSA